MLSWREIKKGLVGGLSVEVERNKEGLGGLSVEVERNKEGVGEI